MTGGIGNVMNGQGFFEGALGSAISTVLFFEIGEAFGDVELFSVKHLKKIALHAIVGGAKSYLEGGKFGHGFASAGVTQGFAPAISHVDSYSLRIVSAAVLGGTASALSGGSFSNGAETAAFSRLFNDELHTEEDTDNASNEEQPSTQQESEQDKQSGNTEEPESLPYSPVPGVYQLKDGPFVSVVLNESGDLVNEDGTTAYSFDSSEGVLTNPRDTGVAESVCPSCYFIGGLAVRGIRSLFAFRGYGWFGSNGLRIGQYRIDAFYSNARSSGGSVFSIKGPYSRIRLDYGEIHKTSTLKWHVTIRFQVGPWKFGSTAQRKPYPPFKKFKK